MKQPWFGKKRIGYGVRPASWQGWVVILVFIVLVTLEGFYYLTDDQYVSFTIAFLATLAAFFLLIKFTYGDD